MRLASFQYGLRTKTIQRSSPATTIFDGLLGRQAIGHQRLELFLIDAADRRFMRDLGQGMSDLNNGDGLGHGLIGNDLRAIDVSSRASCLSFGHSDDFRSGMAFQRNARFN